MILRGHRILENICLKCGKDANVLEYFPVTVAIWVPYMAECMWATIGLSAKEEMYFRDSINHKIHETHTHIEAVQSQVGRSQPRKNLKSLEVFGYCLNSGIHKPGQT